jgi:hypothetical protein
MKVCNKCIINENYPGIHFTESGTCSLCAEQRYFKPLGEDKLLRIFQKAKRKNAEYDALVPLSGGKDSTFILHLAVNIFNLKVITMTYDNGFLSQLALDNIKRAVDITKTKHVFGRSDPELKKKIYRISLLKSGDLCGVCDIATKANIVKVAKEFSIPLILYGNSPLEEDSFVPDSIQDIARIKYILKESNELTRKEINDFLIFPHLNHLSLAVNRRIGIMPKEISPLFYINNPSDKEMGEIITRELDWKADNAREYSKHFDCIAEPMTNYIRYKIYGYERRLCQYSNMIRRNEISREKALEMYSMDDIESKPYGYQKVLEYLSITDEDLDKIITIPALKYEKYTSGLNRFFIRLMKIKKTINKL